MKGNWGFELQKKALDKRERLKGLAQKRREKEERPTSHFFFYFLQWTRERRDRISVISPFVRQTAAKRAKWSPFGIHIKLSNFKSDFLALFSFVCPESSLKEALDMLRKRSYFCLRICDIFNIFLCSSIPRFFALQLCESFMVFAWHKTHHPRISLASFAGDSEAWVVVIRFWLY